MRAFLPTQVTTGTAEHSPALPGDAATAHGGAHAPGPWGPRRTIPLLVGCGLFLAATIAGGTWAILADLRNRALGSAERELQNIVMVLAEQTDRTFQSIELVQKNLIDHVRDAAINSGEDYARLLSSHDVHLMLREKIAGLSYVGALTIIDARGKMVNFSRSWPPRGSDVSDRSYFAAFKSDPQLTSLVSEPVRNRDLVGERAGPQSLERIMDGFSRAQDHRAERRLSRIGGRRRRNRIFRTIFSDHCARAGQRNLPVS